MSIRPIELDELQELKHVPKFNQLVSALSSAALFSISSTQSFGLNLALRGGTFRTPSGIVMILGLQRLLLTASTTNYVYADDAGDVSVTTASPAGWPAPTSGVLALYELDTDTEGIIDGTCFLPSRLSPGPRGAMGVQGPAGTELYEQRPRIQMTVGNSSSQSSVFGTTALAAVSARSLDVTFAKMIPFAALLSSGVANTSAAYAYTPGIWWRGNAAGLGGFKFMVRFVVETVSATMKSFYGLYDYISTPGAVEPNSFINCVGVGANGGETNLSLIHNDGSGTATKTLLVSDDSPSVNFPARTAGKVYELVIECEANGSSFDCSLMDCETLIRSTWSVTSDMPSSSLFLGWMLWVNPGASGAVVTDFIQSAVNSRY